MYSPSEDNPNFYRDLMVKSHDAVWCIFHYQHLFVCVETACRLFVCLSISAVGKSVLV